MELLSIPVGRLEENVYFLIDENKETVIFDPGAQAEDIKELIKEEGPSHDKVFTVQVTVDGKKYKTASGKTKKAAEQMAAKLTMEELTNSSLS